MRNNRIRNDETKTSRFGRASQIFSPSSTSRHDFIVPETSGRQFIPTKHDNMLSNMKIKFLLSTLIKKLKYLTPPLITPSNVEQEWQQTAVQDERKSDQKDVYTKQTLSEQLTHRYETIRHLNLIEGLVVILFCWVVTMCAIFQIKIGFEIIILTLILSGFRIGLLTHFAIRESDNQNNQYVLNIFEDLANPALLMLTCILFLLRDQVDLKEASYVIELFGFIIVILQYKHLGVNFHYLTKLAEQKKMKKQLRIFSLFVLIVTLAHFFALIMYSMTYVAPDGESTWTKSAHLDEKQWHIQYIYCFYWAITTMVTVGYGDLTPSNHIQVVIITIIQLIGTAIFGYMINVIGITVDEIKKKNQQFDNYQQTISKLQDHYQISRQLCNKMKYDIKLKQNQFKSIPLKTSQEKDFLQYIKPNLKQEFVLETNMKVIKKSIFFLTHFSVNFQNEIALKLIRIIYKPQEQILIADSDGQRNLVIINSGCAEIFIQQNHNNIDILKKVRQIKPTEDGLAMNVFGYSSMIMNRNIKLKAIAKQTAVCYVLRRKDVLQCIDKSMLDFESFNEMRQKINLFRFIEEVQAVSLKENEKHFIPNIFLIQKKITYENQRRCYYTRHGKRMKLKLVTNKNYQNKTLPKIEDQKPSFIVPVPGGKSRVFIEEQEFHSLASFQTSNKIEENTYFNENDHFMNPLKIDQCKEFENFMKNFNLSVIAAAYEKSCHKKSYRKRMRTSIISKPGTFIPRMIAEEMRKKTKNKL